MLQKAYITLIPKDKCEESLGKNLLKDYDSQVCARSPEDSKRDACQGDSGGLLTCRITADQKSPYAQVGITSLGRGCGEGSPGVYTRVSHYIDWIAQFTKEIQIIV